jgi:hypothetical protein
MIRNDKFFIRRYSHSYVINITMIYIDVTAQKTGAFFLGIDIQSSAVGIKELESFLIYRDIRMTLRIINNLIDRYLL